MDQASIEEIEAYADDHWEEMLEDLASLVAIESVADEAAGCPDAPFGEGARAALDGALAIAERLGLETVCCEGYIGYADLPGASSAQLGIIGHVDVVPAGAGWTVEPFRLTRKDGFLLGRGVADDKGPLLMALHAAAFWKARGQRLPYSVRVLIGSNEENTMSDVAYYRERFADPDFLFTPDGQFPLCYGEAGILHGTLCSAPLTGGAIEVLEGGEAANAVPAHARAVVRAEGLFPEEGIEVRALSEGRLEVCASGRAAHASLPEQGRNAIGILVDYLARQNVASPREQGFLEVLQRLHRCWDGSSLDLAREDGHLGALTISGTVIALEGGAIRQTVDIRYPTSVTAGEIEAILQGSAAKAGGSFTVEHNKDPFLMDPHSAPVQALLRAYDAVTGEKAAPCTSKGGTYARCFTRGVCFGPEKPWIQAPSWVGGLHCADEGIDEASLKQSFIIYARAIGELMEAGF